MCVNLRQNRFSTTGAVVRNVRNFQVLNIATNMKVVETWIIRSICMIIVSRRKPGLLS